MESKTEVKKKVGRPRKSDTIVQTQTDVPKEPEKKKYSRKKKTDEEDDKKVSNISITKMMEQDEVQSEVKEMNISPVSESKPTRKTIRKKKEDLETDEIQESLSRLSIDENEVSKHLIPSSTRYDEDNECKVKRLIKEYPEYGTEEDYGNEMRTFSTKIYINKITQSNEIDKIGLFYVLLSNRNRIHEDLIGISDIELGTSSSEERVYIEIDNKRRLQLIKTSVSPSKEEIDNDEWYIFCLRYRITKSDMTLQEMYESSKNSEEWFIRNHERNLQQKLSSHNLIYDKNLVFKYGTKYYIFQPKYTLIHLLDSYFSI